MLLQGIVGSLPWQAMLFFTLWLQLLGFSSFTASVLIAIFTLGCAIGGFAGGFFGEFSSELCDISNSFARTQVDSLHQCCPPPPPPPPPTTHTHPGEDWRPAPGLKRLCCIVGSGKPCATVLQFSAAACTITLQAWSACRCRLLDQASRGSWPRPMLCTISCRVVQWPHECYRHVTPPVVGDTPFRWASNYRQNWFPRAA